jgi:hypothetical protein
MTRHEQRQDLERFHRRERLTQWQGTSPSKARPPASTGHVPAAHFGAWNGLTPEQCRVAEHLLARANQRRPLRGEHRQQRQALRIGGIVSAVKRGVVNDSRWGRSMHAKRGGIATCVRYPGLYRVNFAAGRQRRHAQQQQASQHARMRPVDRRLAQLSAQARQQQRARSL